MAIFFEQGHKNVGQALDLVRFRQKELEELDVTGIGRVVVMPGANKHISPPGDPTRINTAKIGAIGTGTKLGIPPLQAADMLAYCVYSALVGRDIEFSKAIIEEIDSVVPHYSVHLSPEKIVEMVDGTLDAEEKWKQFSQEAYRFSKGLRKTGVGGCKTFCVRSILRE